MTQNDDDNDNDSVKASMLQTSKKEADESGLPPKTSRSTSELSQFVGPFHVDITRDTVEDLTNSIDKYLAERKPNIKGEYPDGFQVVFKNEVLSNIQKLKKVTDYRDITLLALQREPSVHDDQGDAAANDGQKSRASDD